MIFNNFTQGFENDNMNYIIRDDEMINDYEFGKRIYKIGLTEALQNYFSGNKYRYS
ncbi:MAG: hypothetical protein JW894_08825 [Bacteroidales bacterium]|nr:hypothetical protein [Bacteroidales bacterium]